MFVVHELLSVKRLRRARSWMRIHLHFPANEINDPVSNNSSSRIGTKLQTAICAKRGIGHLDYEPHVRWSWVSIRKILVVAADHARVRFRLTGAQRERLL